jgi:alkanesulfonate monooxygenase SsuD/methylene tetrahydromethanopterin reductase-like flavin-dependent oxidoreductase (luciferase family)
MRAAETVCTTLVRAGFRFVVFTHSYQYGGMQPLVTMARLAPVAAPLRMATQVLLLPLLNAADVAYNVVTLDHICAGRLDLGLGLAYHLKEVPLDETLLDGGGGAARGAVLERPGDPYGSAALSTTASAALDRGA